MDGNDQTTKGFSLEIRESGQKSLEEEGSEKDGTRGPRGEQRGLASSWVCPERQQSPKNRGSVYRACSTHKREATKDQRSQVILVTIELL